MFLLSVGPSHACDFSEKASSLELFEVLRKIERKMEDPLKSTKLQSMKQNASLVSQLKKEQHSMVCPSASAKAGKETHFR
ncbi:hypothetical protein AV530_016498 [Patagioenas fasciata monilis]|uniref:Uncharacterized protein n=1 Tax=Patagioenas fasciata monilis TaxID=372326 RepID=A0A1V4J2B7_PATFA|nr:hypothetical protein AV530_016498 [Patagioenas fasciata monilis]